MAVPKKKKKHSPELDKRTRSLLISRLQICHKRDTDYVRCFKCDARVFLNHYNAAMDRPQFCEVCKIAYGYE